jgi:hypothetical protein
MMSAHLGSTAALGTPAVFVADAAAFASGWGAAAPALAARGADAAAAAAIAAASARDGGLSPFVIDLFAGARVEALLDLPPPSERDGAAGGAAAAARLRYVADDAPRAALRRAGGGGGVSAASRSLAGALTVGVGAHAGAGAAAPDGAAPLASLADAPLVVRVLSDATAPFLAAATAPRAVSSAESALEALAAATAARVAPDSALATALISALGASGHGHRALDALATLAQATLLVGVGVRGARELVSAADVIAAAMGAAAGEGRADLVRAAWLL